MTNTTTIEILKSQKRALDDLKESNGESYKGVLQRLIESYDSERELTEDDVRDIVRAEVVPEALR